MDEDVVGEDVNVVEVSVTPEPLPEQRNRVLIAAGGVVLFAALLFGAYLAAGDDDSSVDVAAQDDVGESVSDASDDPTQASTDDEAEANSDESDGDDPIDIGGDTTTDASRGDAEFAASDSEFYGGGPNGVIFDGEQFIAIGWANDGQTLRTSNDGLTWDERPFPAFPGLPESANVFQLAAHDGMVIAVVEQWTPQNEEPTDIVEQYFGETDGPTHFIASSTDLENWTLSELPAPSASPDGSRRFRSVTGVAFGDSGLALMTQSYAEGPNEMRMLFDAGILDRTNLEQYCGVNTEDSAGYTVELCTNNENPEFWTEFETAMSAATTDDERAAIEREYEDKLVEPEPEVIATIAPGDPLYAELTAIFEGDGFEPINTVLFGTPTGPFTATDLQTPGYPVGVVEVEGTFVSIIQNWREDGATSTTVSSTDGRTWNTTGSLPSSNFGQLFVVGSKVLAVGGDENGSPLAVVSSDAGATWSPAGLTTELFGAYPQAASGPAGVAVIMQGTTEPYPEFVTPEPLVITKNGFTLTTTYNDEGGRIVLTDSDGKVIYSLLEEEMYSGRGGLEGVVRLSRLTGTPTFLDPVTGDDLVSFRPEDYEAAYEEFAVDEPELSFASEYAFSKDGTTWVTIDDPRLDVDTTHSNIQLIGVGDDEVIFAVHTWTEPPAGLYAFEEEGREPTNAEAQALDAWFSTNGGDNAIEYIRVEVD